MNRWFRVASVLSVALLVSGTTALARAGTPAAPAQAAPSYEPCSTCHDDLAAKFAANPHARAASGRAACESCHGNGTNHADEGDAKLIVVPKGATGSRTCLSCHGGQAGFTHAASGMHASASVYCTDCHSVHGPATSQALLKKPGSGLCVSCHNRQENLFAKPFAHRLGHGGLECYSCHNPHGDNGENSLKRTNSDELPCLSCHTDKRGPFVFSHVTGMAGDCLSCHEPHGSTNPKMLIRARVDHLCLDCHTTLPAGNLGSQPPSFHDLRSPRYTNCTVCHTAVHGSNSSALLLR